MIDMSRRFFLKGAISLVAASTFVPNVSSMGNYPKIYGDGIKDDAEGLGALFRNDPVIFDKEKIGVDEHKLITFHRGKYLISNTVHIPEEAEFHIEMVEFISKLPDDFPFFNCGWKNSRYFSNTGGGVQVIFTVKPSHKAKFITYTDGNGDKGWYV